MTSTTRARGGIKVKPVTKAEFYAAMGPRNVHPRSEPDRCLWIDQQTHAVLGVSTPGYRATGPQTYALAEEAQ